MDHSIKLLSKDLKTFTTIIISFSKHKIKQECIPVGCVPATRRPYA